MIHEGDPMGKKTKSKGEKSPALYAQPKPQSDGEDLWPLVIGDMQDRDRLGKAKYGIGLRPHNGRNALIDAYQEVLDLSVYLRQEIEEQRTLDSALDSLRKIPGYEKSTISDVGKVLGQLVSSIESLREQNRILSATVIHYKTSPTYLSGFDDGIESAIAAIESETGNNLSQQTLDRVYSTIEDRHNNVESA